MSLIGLVALLLLPTPGRAQQIREELRAHPRLTRPPRLLKFVAAPLPRDARGRPLVGAVELNLTRVFQDSGPMLRGVKSIELSGPNWPRSSEGNPWLWVEVDDASVSGPIHLTSCTTLRVSADASDGSTDLSWYLSQGQASLGTGYTGYWDPCGDADTAHLWLVLRNGVGGIDWEEVQVVFGP